ncbi:MAG: hypothetical protein M3O50_03640 [Myxococcota bacterium]|nr:hypothetical protein [Myxococcota bacterium]
MKMLSELGPCGRFSRSRATLAGDALAQRVRQRVVHPLFGVVQDHNAIDLRLRRQLAEHVVLRAAQQERPDDGAELRDDGALRVRGDRTLEAGLERPRRAQDAGVDERRERPELGESILHRRPGQREAHRRVEPTRCPRRLAVGVLDVLRLVEDDAAETNARQRDEVAPEQGIRGDDDVALLDRAHVARSAVQQRHAQIWREALRLTHPVRGD